MNQFRKQTIDLKCYCFKCRKQIHSRFMCLHIGLPCLIQRKMRFKTLNKTSHDKKQSICFFQLPAIIMYKRNGWKKMQSLKIVCSGVVLFALEAIEITPPYACYSCTDDQHIKKYFYKTINNLIFRGVRIFGHCLKLNMKIEIRLLHFMKLK